MAVFAAVFAAVLAAMFAAVFVACACRPLAEGSDENSGRLLVDDVTDDGKVDICLMLARASVRARVLLFLRVLVL